MAFLILTFTLPLCIFDTESLVLVLRAKCGERDYLKSGPEDRDAKNQQIGFSEGSGQQIHG